MFTGGTDTSYIVLEFAMAELIRKPRLMAKLQAEVRSKSPQAQQDVKEDDLSGMAYLKAVVRRRSGCTRRRRSSSHASPWPTATT
jgi:hypothetical protein